MGTYEWKPFTLLVSADEVEKEVLKIEAGKYYKTRDGRKVGPTRTGGQYIYVEGRSYYYDGRRCRSHETAGDLISEWQDETPSPIRTVTRREIVPGQYGLIEVVDVDENGASIWLPRNGRFHSETLREMAHTLNQIAEVLQENGK